MVSLQTSLVGSFPPLYDPIIPIRHLPKEEQDELVRQSIERAVRDQLRIGIDCLVDGQVRDDVVSLLCPHIPGFAGSALPYRITAPVRPSEAPVTVSDYLIAKEFAGGQALKAHLLGPITLVRDAVVEPASGYNGKFDPKLFMDIARVLGEEARCLVEAGADVIQIDEPALTDSRELELAYRAWNTMIEIGEIPIPALHICGNVSSILDSVLTDSPVKIVSLEGSWLQQQELLHINADYLKERHKKLGLGVISVTDYKTDRLRVVQNFLDQMVVRLGEENIWAVMPNCGLRPMPYEVALAKLEVMVAAAKTI
jgi:5-methyltetrahydropteroyltriglutamate--homocysteine methyltransferase